MSRYMQRCLVLGPGGTIGRNGELINGFQDYRAADTATTFAETGTSWVRLWADWPTLQPDPRYLPSDPQSPGSRFWGILLDQVHRARSDGLKIILTLYRYPKWATAAGSEPNPERRDWRAEDRGTRNGTNRKDVLFLLPDDLTPESDWSRWLACVMDGLGPETPARAGATIDAIELINEPNLQVWPIMGPSGTTDPFSSVGAEVTVQRPLAQMLQTAQRLNDARGRPLAVLGPALQDGPNRLRTQIPFDELTALLLDELDRIGFVADESFVWTHHNYRDIEEDRGLGQLSSKLSGDRPHSAGVLHRMLAGRWRGAGAPDGGPTVWLTEGGFRLGATALTALRPLLPGMTDQQIQAHLLDRAWARLHSDAGDGTGIAMLANYLVYSALPTDLSGIRLPPELGGQPRPSYAAWTNMPSEVAPLPGASRLAFLDPFRSRDPSLLTR